LKPFSVNIGFNIKVFRINAKEIDHFELLHKLHETTENPLVRTIIIKRRVNMIKKIHLGASIICFVIGLVGFLSNIEELDNFLQNFSLLYFGLLIIGGFGITKYVYDK